MGERSRERKDKRERGRGGEGKEVGTASWVHERRREMGVGESWKRRGGDEGGGRRGGFR